MINVAINGFGRIGRLVLRAALKERKIKVMAINDLTTPETLAYLFKHDSIHRQFEGKVSSTKDSIIVNNQKIRIFAENEPEKLPWKSLKIDVVVESTGAFRKKELLSKHIEAGAKKVILSAPPKGDEPIKEIVMGVNDGTYKGEDIISN